MATYNTGTEEGTHASLTLSTHTEFLELSGQNGLDVLGVNRQDVLDSTSAQTHSGDIVAAIGLAHLVDTLLGEGGDALFLVGLDHFEEVEDTERILDGCQRRRFAAQLAGILGVAHRLHHSSKHKSDDDEADEQSSERHDEG